MATAFVLVTAEIGQESNVIEELEEIPEVKETNQTYGVYDIIVKVEAESMEELKDVLHYRIRTIDDIRSTMTLIVTYNMQYML